MKNITHASLCTGIGGFDLSAQWMGWQNVFQCETDPFCRQVLRYHFPECVLFGDIKKLKSKKLKKYANRIDVLSAGFPCQPFSVAGQRKGTDDDRYLWDDFLKWYDYCLDVYGTDEPAPNFKHWLKGCPRATEEELKALREKVKESEEMFLKSINNLTDEAIDDLIEALSDAKTKLNN